MKGISHWHMHKAGFLMTRQTEVYGNDPKFSDRWVLANSADIMSYQTAPLGAV